MLSFATAGGGASEARGLASIGAGLRGPVGMTATVYASGLEHQSAYALDAKGRLWVATSGAGTHAADAIWMIPAADGAPVKAVSSIKGPLGLTWSAGTLYVAELGSVEAFSGFDGTRFTTRKTILAEPSDHGWNNGIVATSDGRLVMSISSSCDHCDATSKWTASILTFRPDGSDVRVYASNVRAGYGLALYPGTDDLFATMNQRDDLGKATPGDWLAFVRNGDDWGHPACYGQDTSSCTGVPDPVATLDVHAGAGGVAILTNELGDEAGASALVAEWQLNAVLQVALTQTDSTYTGTPSLFLTGIKNPLPIIALPGGGVLVGSWSTGRIYRIAQD